MITTLNRNAVVVRPTQKLWEWLRSLDGSPAGEYVEDEPTIYLITEQEAEDAAVSALKGHWRKIADAEFEAWWVEPGDWPKISNLKGFQEYFTCSYTEIVHDLSPKKLEREAF